jgi:hypothetical protein
VSNAASSYDRALSDYRDWLNETLFGNKAESDYIIWLGDGRWQVGSYEEPGDVFLVEINRAQVSRV